MLEKLRETFHNGYDDLKELLLNNTDAVDASINAVAETYNQLDGHAKMQKAVCLALGLVNVPGYIAILASDKIVDIVEKVIQQRFDRLRNENKI